MRNFFAVFTLCAIVLTTLPACASGNTRETAITAMFGSSEPDLPHQAVFVMDKNADARLISAARKFCDRTLEFSKGSTEFSIVLSQNALDDLRIGKADAILFEGIPVPEFSPISEAFRYKSYEHFSMTVNSTAALNQLSDILGANVFAGFYAGTNVFLNRGTLDSKFKPQRRSTENAAETSRSSVTTLTDSTAQAFSLLGANVTEENAFNSRVSIFTKTDSIVEFAASELASPILLQAIRAKNLESDEEASAPITDSEDESGEDDAAPVTSDPEPLVVTRAFTGINPVWLIFAPSVYENLPQTGRCAVEEAAAYMVGDIDGIYLKYEQEMFDALLDEDIIISREFTSTRTQALRLANEHAPEMSTGGQKLRETIARVQ